MNNKNIPTLLGTAILVIIAITTGVFVWVYEKGQYPITVQILQPTPKTSKPPVIQESQPTITDATIINGWKKYTAADNSFSIEYPSEWRLEGRSVFYDSSNKKIAEFLPGVFVLSENEQCSEGTEKSIKSMPERVTLISKKSISIDKLSGVHIITKAVMDPGGGYGFSNIYCLKKENRAFGMSSRKNTASLSENDTIFQKILSTLEF